MTEHTDKLVALIKEHRERVYRVDDSLVWGCSCGWQPGIKVVFGPEAGAAYAEHLAMIIRGYLRERPVSWAGPSSDSRVRKAATK